MSACQLRASKEEVLQIQRQIASFCRSVGLETETTRLGRVRTPTSATRLCLSNVNVPFWGIFAEMSAVFPQTSATRCRQLIIIRQTEMEVLLI